MIGLAPCPAQATAHHERGLSPNFRRGRGGGVCLPFAIRETPGLFVFSRFLPSFVSPDDHGVGRRKNKKWKNCARGSASKEKTLEPVAAILIVISWHILRVVCGIMVTGVHKQTAHLRHRATTLHRWFVVLDAKPSSKR